MSRRIMIALILGGLLLASGCWSRVELNQRAIVAGAGIDRDQVDGRLRTTVQVVRLEQNRGGPDSMTSPPAVNVFTDTGYNFFDSIRDLTMEVGKKLFWPASQVIVIGEDQARMNIETIIDWYERDPEPELRNYLLVARGTTAENILSTRVSTNKIWAFGISDLVKATAYNGKAPEVRVKDFLNALQSETTAPIATAVQIIPEKSIMPVQNKTENEKQALTSDLKVSGTAVFHHYRLAGWLNEKETRGMLWVTGKVQGGIIVVPAGQRNDQVALEIIRASSKITPEIKDGQLTITVKVKADSNVGEEGPMLVDVGTPGGIKVLEQMENAVIQSEIRSAIQKAQQLNADIFGFGEATRRAYPQGWKQIKGDWNRIFPDLKVKVQVQAKVRRTGKITNPTEPQ